MTIYTLVRCEARQGFFVALFAMVVCSLFLLNFNKYLMIYRPDCTKLQNIPYLCGEIVTDMSGTKLKECNGF